MPDLSDWAFLCLEIMEAVKLTSLDYQAKSALKRYAEARLADLRDSLEGLGLDPRLADVYRGRITELKDLLEQIAH